MPTLIIDERAINFSLTLFNFRGDDDHEQEKWLAGFEKFGGLHLPIMWFAT